MRQVMNMERRLQDLERAFQNQERRGKIVAVKSENQRWFVKFNDGSDDKPFGSEEQGSSSGSADAFSNLTYKSDWLPWAAFSHATIKTSIPPKEGQYAVMRSPGGSGEQAVVEPYHYGPENPSPSSKKDEVVTLVEHEENSKKTEQAPSIFGSGSTGSFALVNISSDPISMGLSKLREAGIDPSVLNFGPNGIKIPDIQSVQGLANQVIGPASDPIAMAKASIQQAIKSAAGNMMGFLQGKMQGLMQAKNDAKTDKQNVWTREASNTHHLVIGRKPEQNPEGQSQGEGRKTQEKREMPDVPKEGAEKTLQVLATDKGWLLTHGKSKTSIAVDENDIFIVNEKMAFHVNKEEAKISKGDTKLSLTEDLITVTAKNGSKLEMSEDTIKAAKGESMISIRDNAITTNVGDASTFVQQAGGLKITAGGVEWEFTGEGFKQTGGKMSHDNKNVGATHKHTDVMAGPAQTGFPIPAS
jgi:hypothetical protein